MQKYNYTLTISINKLIKFDKNNLINLFKNAGEIILIDTNKNTNTFKYNRFIESDNYFCPYKGDDFGINIEVKFYSFDELLLLSNYYNILKLLYYDNSFANDPLILSKYNWKIKEKIIIDYSSTITFLESIGKVKVLPIDSMISVDKRKFSIINSYENNKEENYYDVDILGSMPFGIDITNEILKLYLESIQI